MKKKYTDFYKEKKLLKTTFEKLPDLKTTPNLFIFRYGGRVNSFQQMQKDWAISKLYYGNEIYSLFCKSYPVKPFIISKEDCPEEVESMNSALNGKVAKTKCTYVKIEKNSIKMRTGVLNVFNNCGYYIYSDYINRLKDVLPKKISEEIVKISGIKLENWKSIRDYIPDYIEPGSSFILNGSDK